jgi:polyferredoxin
VHLAVLFHVAHWKLAGRTLGPVEPSEAMRTLELGYVNAGFLLFALAILATLVFGRFFCGWACHVVAYQDLCAWLLSRLGLRPRPVRSRLLVFVPLGAAVYMFLWPQLERWLAGRARPALALELATDDLWATFPGPWIAALTLLVDGALVVWLLGAKGFCTYGCPYGAVFGIAARAAPGRIRVTDACEGCGHCTAACTSNVRVHEEVARYGEVVDPGCMRCTDCVSVCPKGALFFGFAPAHTRRRERPPKLPRPRRTYDFTWGEELAAAAVFGAALYALRGLYGAVPFLLAIGLAVLAALAAVALWRALRSPDFDLQHHALKRGGRLTPAGGALLGIALPYLVFVGHSGFVNHQAQAGTRLFEAGRARPEERAELFARSLVHHRRAARAGLFGVAANEYQVALILRESKDWAGAEEHLRRAVELDPRAAYPRLDLADVLLVGKRFAEAEALLEGLLADDPGFAPAEQRLAALRASTARR